MTDLLARSFLQKSSLYFVDLFRKRCVKAVLRDLIMSIGIKTAGLIKVVRGSIDTFDLSDKSQFSGESLSERLLYDLV